jgi:hypothetical protein
MANPFDKIIDKSKQIVSAFKPDAYTVMDIPDDPKRLADFVNTCYEDSKKWREDSFDPRLDQNSLLDLWKNCHRLMNGDHWKVWSTRRGKEKDDWKSELVDDEIGTQIRVKLAYLTANWHQFEVMPNIANIGDIVFQEQEKTLWGTRLIEGVKRQLSLGATVFKNIMDFERDPRGLATEIVCDNASIFPSPFTTEFTKEGGCRYIIHATIQPIWKVREKYADSMKKLGVDPTNIKMMQGLIQKDIETNPALDNLGKPYKTLNATDVLELWIDDPRLEETPFDPQEAEAEHSAIVQGQDVPVLPEQNHKAHIEAHNAKLAELGAAATNEQGEVNPEDKGQTGDLANAFARHMRKHLVEGNRLDGQQLVYPYGRKIVRAGGEIVEDVPNPYTEGKIDWRRLFTIVNYEQVPGQLWGRGMAEILWNTNKVQDLMLSRIADMGLASVPKPWFSEEDREVITKDGLDNDPTNPGYYQAHAPVFPQGGRSPVEFLQVYKMNKDISEKTNAISNVTYGESPTPRASGDLAELLLRQNSVVVTGEAQIHLNDAIERIIETRLLMMRQLYTEDRQFYIQGRYQTVNVSKILSVQEKLDDQTGQVLMDQEKQQPIYEPIPALEVRVKPHSNLPNQFELDLQVAIQLYNMKRADGTPFIPDKAVYDVLAQRYPQYSTAGAYYQLNQLISLGMQKAQEMQAQQEQEQDQHDRVQKIAQGVADKKMRDHFQAVADEAGGSQPQKGA